MIAITGSGEFLPSILDVDKKLLNYLDEDQINIDELTIELSGIIAQSKVNFSNLPEIEEFNNHRNLVEVAPVSYTHLTLPTICSV